MQNGFARANQGRSSPRFEEQSIIHLEVVCLDAYLHGTPETGSRLFISSGAAALLYAAGLLCNCQFAVSALYSRFACIAAPRIQLFLQVPVFGLCSCFGILEGNGAPAARKR
eukprot:5077074-Pleurochrysis_carterae.AAC.6